MQPLSSLSELPFKVRIVSLENFSNYPIYLFIVRKLHDKMQPPLIQPIVIPPKTTLYPRLIIPFLDRKIIQATFYLRKGNSPTWIKYMIYAYPETLQIALYKSKRYINFSEDKSISTFNTLYQLKGFPVFFDLCFRDITLNEELQETCMQRCTRLKTLADKTILETLRKDKASYMSKLPKDLTNKLQQMEIEEETIGFKLNPHFKVYELAIPEKPTKNEVYIHSKKNSEKCITM